MPANNIQTVEEKIKYFEETFKDDVLFIKISQLGWLEELLSPSTFYEEIILDLTYTTKKAGRLLDIAGREQILLNYLNRNGFSQYVDVYRQGEKGYYKYSSKALFQFKMILLLIDHSITPLEIGAILGIKAEVAHEGSGESSPKRKTREVDEALVKAEINDYLNERLIAHQQQLDEREEEVQERIQQLSETFVKGYQAREKQLGETVVKGYQEREKKILLHTNLQIELMRIEQKIYDWDNNMQKLVNRQDDLDFLFQQQKIMEESLSIGPISKLQKLFTSKEELEKKEALKKQVELQKEKLTKTREKITNEYNQLEKEKEGLLSELADVKLRIEQSKNNPNHVESTAPRDLISTSEETAVTSENHEKK